VSVVLVDAENVRRSLWPNIGERRLVELVRRWADDHARQAIVVFDGKAPGGIVGVQALDERCVVVGSGDASADDWITRRAEELEREGQPFWLVTSDRELRTVAGRAAERTVGGGSFARELT
jgi:predicted RNA-binding protein with PIN domain